MGGVLDQRLRGGEGRLHVGSAGAPRRGVVFERPAGGDYRAEVDVHAFQLAGSVEAHPGSQIHDHLAAGAGAQRMIGQLGGGDAVHGARLAGGPQLHGVDDPVRMRVGQRVQPAAWAGVAPGTVAGLAAAVGCLRAAPRSLIFSRRRDHLISEQRYCGKRAGAPADARLLDGEPAPNRVHVLGSVSVAQHVVGHVIAELIAVRVAVREAGQVVGDAVGNVVDEHQVTRGQAAGGDGDRFAGHQHHVVSPGRAEQERDAAERLGAEGLLQGMRAAAPAHREARPDPHCRRQSAAAAGNGPILARAWHNHIISMDPVIGAGHKGIRHLHIREFLLTAW